MFHTDKKTSADKPARKTKIRFICEQTKTPSVSEQSGRRGYLLRGICLLIVCLLCRRQLRFFFVNVLFDFRFFLFVGYDDFYLVNPALSATG